MAYKSLPDYTAFIEEAVPSLLGASGDFPLSIYTVGDEGTSLGSFLSHYLREFHDRNILLLSVPHTVPAAVSGWDDLTKRGRQRYLDSRYQLICIGSEGGGEHAYRVGRALREAEDALRAVASGISVATLRPPLHQRFHEVTRERLLNPLRRASHEEERPVYGSGATLYVDDHFTRLWALTEGEVLDVLERKGYEYTAQYLLHRLLQSGRQAGLALPPERGHPERRLVIPGPKDEVIVQQMDPEFVLWLGDI